MQRWGMVGLVLAVVALCGGMASVQAGEGVLELRIYTCEPGKLEALNERFRNHTMRLFEKHGMKNIAYWEASEGPTAGNTLYYIIHHASRDAAKKSWADFQADPEWQAVRKASEEKYGKILSKAPEAIYMTETDYSPPTEKARQDKVYELRTYTTALDKLPGLHSLLSGEGDKLLKAHGLRSVGYWSPTDEPHSKNTLIHVLEHRNLEAAKESWVKLNEDRRWTAAKKKVEEEGTLLAVPPEAVYLKTVDYSPQP